jgi:hypothetical protein
VVLRYLQGYDQAEAARQAGCSKGTLASRASRGIERLRQRLAKRGVALGGAALVGLLTSEASAAVPETLLPSILATVKTAVATTATATGASSTAAMLAKGAMKAMLIAKVKLVAAIAAAVIVTGTAVPVGIAVAQAVGKDEESSAKKTDVDTMLKQAQDLLSQGRKAEAYEKAGRTADAIAAYRATMTKYPGTPESALAHSALEKMESRSSDATHVALTGKPATIKGTAIPQIEPANERVKKYLGNLRARADGMEGLLPIVTMSDADRSVAIPEIIKMLRDPTPIPGTGGGGPVGPDGSGGRRVVVRNRAAEALSLAAGISFGFFFVMDDKGIGEADEKQIAEAVIGRVETWWATAQGKTRAQWLKDRLPDLQRQINDVQKDSLANHSLLIIAATGDRTAADTLLEAVEKHVPKLEFKPLQKDAMTALMEEIARALAKLGDRKMIPRLVAVGRHINRPEVAYNNKLLFHFAQTLNKWAGGLKLDPFEPKTYNLDMNGKPMIRADVEVIAPAAFDTWFRMAE